MEFKNFSRVIERAKQINQRQRVVIAGADAENILLGAFQAQFEGFATPVLVGQREKIEPILEKIGMKDQEYRIVEVPEGQNVTQAAIDLINKGEGDVLMRGNIQTRDFLIPLLDRKNELRTDKLLTHIDLISMPDYPKLLAIGDVTITIEPNQSQKKKIIQNMVDTLKVLGYEKPKIALLSLVEHVSFHMQDTIDARELVREQEEQPFADCELCGPISYDLILSKEAARLKGYDSPLCGDFDGILAPSLLAGNLIVKGWQMHARAHTCGVIVGAKIPVAITSRSDSPEVSYLSLAFCAALKAKQQ